MSGSDVEDAYYIAVHRHSFRPGEPALVLGVALVDGRACLDVIWPDGYRDYAPLGEVSDGRPTYELVGVLDAWGRKPAAATEPRWLVEWWSLDRLYSDQTIALSLIAALTTQQDLEYRLGYRTNVRRLP